MNKSCLRFLNQKTVEKHGGLFGLMKHDVRESIWEDQEINDDYKGKNKFKIIRKIENVVEDLTTIVKAKTKRGVQKNAMIIREAVVELPENTSLEKLITVGEKVGETPIYRSSNKLVIDKKTGKKSLVSIPLLDVNNNQIKSPLGIKLFAAFLHVDEGNWINQFGRSACLLKGSDGNWHDPTGVRHDPKKEGLTWKQHWHGHLWFACVDHETGKTIRPSTDELSQIQTLVANELGMERGIIGSKARHKGTTDYKRDKINEELKKEKERLQKEVKDLGRQVEALEGRKKSIENEMMKAGKKLQMVEQTDMEVSKTLKRILGSMILQDYWIESEEKECTSPLGEKSSYVDTTFMIRVMTQDNEMLIIPVKKNDYYNKKDPLKSKLSYFFFYSISEFEKKSLESYKRKGLNKGSGPSL